MLMEYFWAIKYSLLIITNFIEKNNAWRMFKL